MFPGQAVLIKLFSLSSSSTHFEVRRVRCQTTKFGTLCLISETFCLSQVYFFKLHQVEIAGFCFFTSTVLIHEYAIYRRSSKTMSEKALSEEGSFKNADGKNIFTKYWKPGDKKPR